MIDLPGIGGISLYVPEQATPVTPGSRITISAVAHLATDLSGVGMDWGTGVGGVAVALAHVPAVRRVVAVDVSRPSLDAARINAAENGVADRIDFVWADLMSPLDEAAARTLQGVASQLEFLIANPPGSGGDDGLGWRRQLLAAATRVMRADAVAYLQVSAQYGSRRIEGIAADAGGWEYGGLVLSSPWQPFDLERADLRELLDGYVRIEEAGGRPYEFGEGARSALQVRNEFEANRTSPQTLWQVHRYQRSK